VTDRPGAAFIDATAGVAGDMLLAALLDAGADLERVRGAIASLSVPGLGLRTEAARRGGLACLRAVITTPTVTDRPRHLAEVLGHVGASDLHPAGKDLAARVFRLLAEAEGAVHGEPPEDVHFHEVGAFDSLADVVGSAAALQDLGLLRPGAVVCCSALAAGSGFVTSRHGRLPVPAPAVLRIAAAAGLDLAGGELAGERTTPTGAALLAAAATPGGFPAMAVRAVGTGGGGRDTPDRPNITRVVIGAASGAERDLREGDVTVVESTVDDLDPRLWPSVLQAVRAAGAWDCWCTQIVGRHGRPGQVLTALCAEPVRRAVAAAMFAHTGTLGVRWSRMNRLTASRTSVEVEVGPPGRSQIVTVKVADTTDGIAGYGTATAELAEAEAAARSLGWPVRAVCEAAVAQYRAQAAIPRLPPNSSRLPMADQRPRRARVGRPRTLCAGSPDPVRGRGIPPRPPGDPADRLAPIMRPERLVIPDRVDFHVAGTVEHQVAAPGLRQRDPVQVRVVEHRVGRMRQPDPGAVTEGLHHQARAVIARGAAGPAVVVPAAFRVAFGPVQSRVARAAPAVAADDGGVGHRGLRRRGGRSGHGGHGGRGGARDERRGHQRGRRDKPARAQGGNYHSEHVGVPPKVGPT